MQSLSLTLTKRLSNSKPLSRISSHLIAYTSSATASSPSPLPLPPSPPISAPSATPWLATQSRGIALSGSDVRVGNLIGNRGRAHEVLKMYRPCEGTGRTTLEVPPHTVAGYSTVAAAEDDIKRKERQSGLSKATKTKREQILKATAVASLLLLYPNAYSLLLANFFVFWHIHAGIGEILADYVHHEMTREFVMISLRLFLIIAAKDVSLNFIL